MSPRISPAKTIGALGLLFLVLTPHPAHAYIDPATGSYVLQLILGTLLGALYAVKMYWSRIKAFFFRGSGESMRDEDGED